MSTVRNCAGSAVALAVASVLGCNTSGACSLPPFEPVTLLPSAHDPHLADGRILRLAGLTPVAAAELLSPGPAWVSVLGRQPDRWGRLPAILVAGQGGFADSVNLALLRQGAGLVLPGDWPKGCEAAARAAEAEARQAGRGVWATHPVLDAGDLDGLRAREGRFALVSGVLISVRQGRRQVFLNFGAFGSDRFSATVALARVEAFRQAGLDLAALRGRSVELRGVVGAGPSMELQGPEALTLLRGP